MFKQEILLREILCLSMNGMTGITQSQLSTSLRISLGMVNKTILKLRRMGSVRINTRNFNVIDCKRLLLYWATIRNIERDVVYSTRANLPVKLGAFSNRYNSIKGDKDRLDLVGLLSVVDIDMSILRNIFIKYNLRNYPLLLKNALSGIDYKLLPYIKQNEITFSKLKRDLINRIDRTDWTSSTI